MLLRLQNTVLFCGITCLAACSSPAPSPTTPQVNFRAIYAQTPVEQATVLLTVVASKLPAKGAPLRLGSLQYVEPDEPENGGHRYIDLVSSSMDAVSGAAVYTGVVTLRPGRYILTRISFDIDAVVGPAWGEIPVQAEIDVPRSGAMYVGRINAVMRPRAGDEFRAGIFGLDHLAAGVFNGTFDVNFSDSSTDDIPYFLNKFHYLSRPMITTKILPPFDRAKAQWLWENNRLFLPGPVPGQNAPR